jgi:hypothetical protein
VSAAFQLLLDRIENHRSLPRLAEALSPEAAAPLDHLTPLADAWRKFREADLASKGEIIEQGGDRHAPEVTQAINDREELDCIFAALPSGSPAGAIVRILWAVLHHLHTASDAEGKAEPTSMWEATLFEATLDLLQPGVLQHIASGLAGRTRTRDTAALPAPAELPAPPNGYARDMGSCCGSD